MSDRRSATEDIKVVDRFWPALTESEVHTVFQHYPSAGNLQDIRWQSARPLSSAGLARTDRGLFFIKRHSRVVRTPEDLSFEHQLAAFLSRMGLDSPMVILTSTGADTLSSPDWVYEVFTPALGDDRYRESHTWSRDLVDRDSRELGKTVAEMHRNLADCAIAPRKVRYQRVGWDLAGAVDLESALHADLANRPGLGSFLKESDIKAIAQAFEPFVHAANQFVGKDRQISHGDPQANNFFWAKNQVASVIDFHLAGLQPPLAELACAVDRNGLHWLEILEGNSDAWSPEKIEGVLRGYHGVFPLSRDGAEGFVALLALHRLDFAWSLLDYYATVERSEVRAAWCRDVFLQAHPRWLSSPSSIELKKFLYNFFENLTSP